MGDIIQGERSFPGNGKRNEEKEEGLTMAQTPDMETLLTIQQVAQETGLSAYTLRYYERAGLINQHIERDQSSGHRTYTRDHLEWFEFIKRLRATGMPIRDIRRYAEFLNQGEQTVQDRMHLLKQHRTRIETHLKETEDYLASLNEKIAYYEEECAQKTSMACSSENART